MKRAWEWEPRWKSLPAAEGTRSAEVRGGNRQCPTPSDVPPHWTSSIDPHSAEGRRTSEEEEEETVGRKGSRTKKGEGERGRLKAEEGTTKRG